MPGRRHATGPGGPARFAVAALAALLAALAIPAGAPAHGGASHRWADLTGVDLSAADRCDPISPARCLLPFPDDFFTRRDPRSPTGLRLSYDPRSMPSNTAGVPVSPADINRSDGFSPGQPVIVKVPGLDTPPALAQTAPAPITDIGASLDRGAPIVAIDATTLRRTPIWSELDATAPTPATTALITRPATNWLEGHRYIVAMRRLRGADGSLLPAPKVFAAYRDRLWTREPAIERRRGHMEWLFARLRRAGIPRHDLYLAWDFTVASRQGLTARALAIRNDAFAQLGETRTGDLRTQGEPPRYTITSVEQFTPEQNPNTARRVRGTVEVPCYLDQPGCPTGSRFALSAGGLGLPERTPGNVIQAPFICDVPQSAVAPGAAPARPVIYGHGLLGDPAELTAPQFQAARNRGNLVFCGTPWIGMSIGDIGTVARILGDVNHFPELADRLQQSFVDFQYLGRLMIHPRGFGADPAFQKAGGASVLSTGRLYYNGNSQGGILGGALGALGIDFNRAVLGVPAQNYSTLLQRSTDFVRFAPLMNNAYPDAIDRQLGLSMIQLLWDRAEANGYTQHLTRDPLPGTPRKDVILLEAFGDHQVANVATENEARTIGGRLRTPALDPGRSLDSVPFWGIPTIRRYPYRGSALVLLDIGPLRTVGGQTLGTPPSPLTNTPQTLGRDPHGAGGDEPWVHQMVDAFFQPHGVVIDPCAGKPCYADGWTGP